MFRALDSYLFDLFLFLCLWLFFVTAVTKLSFVSILSLATYENVHPSSGKEETRET